jgi:hypothetical protein
VSGNSHGIVITLGWEEPKAVVFFKYKDGDTPKAYRPLG